MTEDILKALQNCIHGVGSITEFSQQTNVTIDTLSKFLSRQSDIIRKETWVKLQPLLQPYLQKNHNSAHAGSEPPRRAIPASTKHLELDSDQKILLDAFGELPKALQDQKLLEIVELAKVEIKKKNEEMQ
jgi:hypothetical protein